MEKVKAKNKSGKIVTMEIYDTGFNWYATDIETEEVYAKADTRREIGNTLLSFGFEDFEEICRF